MCRSRPVSQLVSRLVVCDCSSTLTPYGTALQLQQHLAEQCKNEEIPDTLLQLQHPPVYTLGKRGREEDFIAPRASLESSGAEIFSVGRGGETTFHGPGQLVLYPIVDLRRVGRGARAYVEGLEDTVISALREFSVSAKGRQPGRTGVWVDERKIAAIGVQISRGIATHGLALNVTTDLAFFDHIVPCGLADKEVTTLGKETGAAVDIKAVTEVMTSSFVREFRYSHVDYVSIKALVQDTPKAVL